MLKKILRLCYSLIFHQRVYKPRFWASVSIRNLEKLPQAPGVYVVRSFGRYGPMKYIGETNNLYNRWNRTGRYEHHRKKQAMLLPFGTLNYYTTKDHEFYESQLLRVLGKPPWNWTSVPGKGYVGAIIWYLQRIRIFERIPLTGITQALIGYLVVFVALGFLLFI